MKIALIGTGKMGIPMGEKLLEDGYELNVYNRSGEKMKPLIEKGAKPAESPAKAASDADIIISILTNSDAVKECALGENGILNSMKDGAVYCDMSTVSAAWAEEIEQIFVMRGHRFIQAPVLGSVPQVNLKKLIVFAGGKDSSIQKIEPVLKSFSSDIFSFPSAKKSIIIKLAFNMLIAHMTVGLGQSLVFMKKCGLNPDVFMDVLGKSVLNSTLLQTKGKAILDRNFDAHFYVRHMLKDLGLAQDAARETDVPLLWNAITREIFVAAENAGLGNEDYSATIKILENMAGTKVEIFKEE